MTAPDHSHRVPAHRNGAAGPGASARPAVLTVLLAPPDGAAEVLDVLVDLSGAELVDEFLWVTAGRDAAVVVAHGRRTPTSVADVVVGARPARVRLCVLVPVGAGDLVPGHAEQEVAGQLTAGAAGAPVTLVRCLLTRGRPPSAGGLDDAAGVRPGSRPDRDGLAREGWHNVLVAPERATGPSGGRGVLPATVGADEAARHLAPSLAGLLGLCRGARDCPFDDLPVPPGPTVRLARSFYRRVEADDVERTLRGTVLATRPSPPQPRQAHGIATAYLADPVTACTHMARQLWERHVGLLTGPRNPVPERPLAGIGPGTALVWFPNYLRRALRDRPGSWLVDLRAALLDEVPHVLQDQVISVITPADHRTVVDGYRPDGQHAGWRDVRDVVDRVEAALPPDPAAPPLPDDLAALWQDFAGGAMTLVDAGDRGGQAMPPARNGPVRGILRSTDECVPGPGHDLVLGHGNVAAITGVPTLAVGDVLGARLLRRRLGELAGQQALGGAARSSVDQLRAWEERYRGTYVQHVSERLADRLEEVGHELHDQLAALAEAANPGDPAPARRRRMQLTSRAVVGLVGVALLVMGVFAVLAAVAVIAWGPAALTLLGAAVAGAVLSTGVYGIGALPVFRDLDRRRQVVARVEADQPNLRRALRDYRRLADAYAEFLLWSRSVAAVLEEPFGRAADAERTDRPVLHDLPPSMRTGRAATDPGAMAVAATTLRAELFVTGWLEEPWRANLPEPAGPTSAMPVRGPDGRHEQALGRWVDALRHDGPSSAIGDAAWATAMTGLSGRHRAIGEALLSTIRDDDPPGGEGVLGIDAGGSEALTMPEFFAGIDRAEVTVPPGDLAARPATSRPERFDAAHFSADARTQDRARVAGTGTSSSRSGLSRIDVLVQYGEPVPPWELDLGLDPDDDPDGDPDDRPAGPGQADLTSDDDVGGMQYRF